MPSTLSYYNSSDTLSLSACVPGGGQRIPLPPPTCLPRGYSAMEVHERVHSMGINCLSNATGETSVAGMASITCNYFPLS